MKEEVQDMFPLVSITACFPTVAFPNCFGSPASVMIFVYIPVFCVVYTLHCRPSTWGNKAWEHLILMSLIAHLAGGMISEEVATYWVDFLWRR